MFLSDRTVRRRAGWRRAIELQVPVIRPRRWAGLATDAAHVLDLLSGDDWTLRFVARPSPRGPEPAAAPRGEPVDRVLLFSGGADSLCGAVESLASGERLLLASHWDWTGHAGVQRALAGELEALFPGQVQLRQVRLGTTASQGVESTRRTRSLLFLALGLAHAAASPGASLWMAENGYAALNPPLAGERRGALSTRTTHPLVLHELKAVVTAAGGLADFSNPFDAMTKGEMFDRVADHLGKTRATALLARSHSCSHVRYAAGTGYPPQTQCGVCYGRLVRRAAFAAAGMADATTYLHQAIRPSEQPPHLRETAHTEVVAVRYARTRGVDAAALLAVGLPDTVPIEAAVDVAQRGLAELGAVVDAEPDLAAIR